MTLKIQKEHSKDLVLIAGDFNVFRYPMNEHTTQSLFVQNGKWPNYFNQLDTEYKLLLTILSANGRHDIVNLWDKDNPEKDMRCVTVGDVIEGEFNKDGTKKARDDVMTL